DGPAQLRSPTSVDTDAQGRVYVADPFNERIQVYDPSGRHLKSIPVPGGEVSRPVDVVVDQRRGDIYAFAYYVDCHAFRKAGAHQRKAKLFHFGPFERPDLKAEYPLPIADQSGRGVYGGDHWQGRELRATIDPWAPGDTPYVWMYLGFAPRGQRSILTPMVYRINPEKKTLDLVKSFDEQCRKDLGAEDDGWGWGGRGLVCQPTTGDLYVTGGPPVVITPDTGKVRIVRFPSGSPSYFDREGLAYVRDAVKIARYDLSGNSCREVPFDYGEERPGYISVVPLLPSSLHCMGAFSVSIHGHVVVGAVTGRVDVSNADSAAQRIREVLGDAKPWRPPLFEGRGGNSILRVYDKHGKVVHEDAAKGVGYMHGVFMDERGGLYLVTEAQRAGYFDDLTGMVVKFRPNGKILWDNAVLPMTTLPSRTPDAHKGAGHQGSSWWEGAEWFYGGIGYGGKNNSTCHCPAFSCAFDYFARTFAPET
ncbi:MAG: hypothetical protein N3A38_16655, partial [Planctomycetota bacterium]|nr:hypothetical protein [Planctomycetota bacterium]